MLSAGEGGEKRYTRDRRKARGTVWGGDGRGACWWTCGEGRNTQQAHVKLEAWERARGGKGEKEKNEATIALEQAWKQRRAGMDTFPHALAAIRSKCGTLSGIVLRVLVGRKNANSNQAGDAKQLYHMTHVKGLGMWASGVFAGASGQ